MRNFSRLLVFDLPIGTGVNQAPIWLLWLTWPGLVFGVFILFGFYQSFSVSILVEFIVLLQLPLLAYYLSEKRFSFDYTTLIHSGFIALYLISVLLDIYFPDFKNALTIFPRGLENNRHSFLSTEPSFFAELVVTSLIILLCQRKILLFSLSVVVFFGLSLSKTIPQQLIVFISVMGLVTLVMRGRTIRVSAGILRTFYIFTVCVAMLLLMSPFFYKIAATLHSELNSWRLSSNVMAMNIASTFPNPEYRDDVVDRAYNYVNWMKNAVWSFYPTMSSRFGILVTTVYLILTTIYLIRPGSYVISNMTITLIVYSILCLVMFSPKWNLTQQYLLFWALAVSRQSSVKDLSELKQVVN